jgi:hypothetical protein
MEKDTFYSFRLNAGRFWRVLMMAYNTRSYWVYALCPSSGVIANTTFRKLDIFPSSGEEVGHTYSEEFFLL